MDTILQFWDTISNTTDWWVSLLVMVALYFTIAVLFFIREHSDGSGLRSFLDLAMGVLNCVVIWQALMLFYNLGWTNAIKDGFRWFLRLFGEDSHLGYYAMSIVATGIFLLLWEYIFIPIFLRAGSNFSVKIISGGFMAIYGLWLIADAVSFAKGLMSIVSLCLCGFIALLALIRVVSYVNSKRCPNCHTIFNIRHISKGYIGQMSKKEDYVKTDKRTQDGANELIYTKETEKGIKTETFDVYSTDHGCKSCGWVWNTYRKIKTGESETPTQCETETTTVRWN